MSNDGSLSLISCLSGGYKFASVLRCVGLVVFNIVKNSQELDILTEYMKYEQKKWCCGS